MSNLKNMTVEDLEKQKTYTEQNIAQFSSELSGQRERLKWINHYIFDKTPQEMSWSEMERALGHKVIIT